MQFCGFDVVTQKL